MAEPVRKVKDTIGMFWVYLRALLTGSLTSQPARHVMLGMEGWLVAYHDKYGWKGGYAAWDEECDGVAPGIPIWYPLDALYVGPEVERARIARETRRRERDHG